MISANEAKQKSLISAKCKLYMDELDKAVKEASARGERTARIKIDLTGHNDESKECGDALIAELKSLGYDAYIVLATECPVNCPSSQWDFNNGSIRVSW